MVTSVPYQLRSSQIARERERAREPTGSAPATCGAATWSTTPRGPAGRRGDAARAPGRGTAARPVPGRGAVHGRGRPGRARRPLRRPAATTTEGRVVFVRHALPGERVDVEVTEGTRATGSCAPTRSRCSPPPPTGSTPPCPFAGPGRCGGCDFQHVALDRPARLKADGGRASSCAGSPASTSTSWSRRCPATTTGLRWRTRLRYAGCPTAGAGMRKHRSHEVVPVDDCLHRGARRARARPVVPVASRPASTAASRSRPTASGRCTPARPTVLVETVLDCSRRSRGSGSLDLYAGVGPVRRASSPTRRRRTGVVAVEGDRQAAARRRSQPAPDAAGRGAGGRSTGCCATAYDEPFDLVVLDPPREGAKREVVEQVVGPRAAGGRVRRLRPGRAGPRRRDLRRARLRAGGAAGLRPVPDDAPRRMRRAADENRL